MGDMRRRDFLGKVIATAGAGLTYRAMNRIGMAEPTRKLATPTKAQLQWQDGEIGVVYHYDMTTFRDYGAGSGHSRRIAPEPGIYNPTKLDTDQWIEAAKGMGATFAFLTATHETGFMQWQTDLYPYSARQSPWRNGKGDLVAEFVESCRKYDILPAIYLGIRFNAYHGVYQYKLTEKSNLDDISQYMRLCEKMVEQICSRYGNLLELWFDGGVPTPEQGGPNLLPIVNEYQPSIVYYHSDERRDHRWIGNEEGVAGYPCWATCASIETAKGQGVPGGPVWSPAMCDVPLRDHKWFWNPGQQDCLESLNALMNMYYKSVGRNCSLIVGAVPNREGLLDDVDVRRMNEFGREVEKRFEKPLATTSGKGNVVELELPRPQKVDHVSIMEQVSRGERIREYKVEGLVAGGAWKKLCEGQSVGHKRIQRFRPQHVARLRLRVTKSAAPPIIRDISAYDVG